MAAGIVPAEMADIYAAHITTPTTPTSCGFSVRSHKIPITSDQKMINDKPPNMVSNGFSITFSGSLANIQVPSSTHVGFSGVAFAIGSKAATLIRFRLNATKIKYIPIGMGFCLAIVF